MAFGAATGLAQFDLDRQSDDRHVDLPAHRALALERRPWWHKVSLESTPALANADLRHFRERYSRTPQQSDEQLRHLIASYHGMTSLIDHNVGRILIALLKGPMKYDGLLRLFLPSHMGFH